MIEVRTGPPESIEQQALPCARQEKILSADDLSYIHGMIVGNGSQLIRSHALLAPNQKVRKILACNELLHSLCPVEEGNLLVPLDSEAPIDSSREIRFDAKLVGRTKFFRKKKLLSPG